MANLLGERIKKVRDSIGKSVEEAAAIANMNPADWETIEAGESIPDFYFIAIMASAMDVAIISLLE